MADFEGFEPEGVDPFTAAADETGDIDNAFGLGDEPVQESPAADDDPFATTTADDDDVFGLAGDDVEETPADEDVFALADGDTMEPVTEVPVEDMLAPAEEPVFVGDDDAFEEKAEPTPFQLWEEKRNEVLRQRRDKAYGDKDGLEEAGKVATAEFYTSRETRIKAIQETNREDEKKTVADMESLMEFGSQWEKVAKLVNLTPDPNEKPGTSKVDRLRQLLIQLKNEKATE